MGYSPHAPAAAASLRWRHEPTNEILRNDLRPPDRRGREGRVARLPGTPARRGEWRRARDRWRDRGQPALLRPGRRVADDHRAAAPDAAAPGAQGPREWCWPTRAGRQGAARARRGPAFRRRQLRRRRVHAGPVRCRRPAPGAAGVAPGPASRRPPAVHRARSVRRPGHQPPAGPAELAEPAGGVLRLQPAHARFHPRRRLYGGPGGAHGAAEGPAVRPSRRPGQRYVLTAGTSRSWRSTVSRPGCWAGCSG